MLSLTNQRFVFFGIIFIYIWCSIYFLFCTSNITGKEADMIHPQLRLQELNTKNKAKEEAVSSEAVLYNHLTTLYDVSDKLHDKENLLNDSHKLSAKARAFLRNRKQKMYVPSTYYFQPHLKGSSLYPALVISKGRSGVSMALGIPTVKRHSRNYLLPTLKNILNGMTEPEKDDTIIIVFFADTKNEILYPMINKIVKLFTEEVNCGLLELISPPATYYPEMSQLRLTLGDSKARVRWRTKQNLDCAFLMMYAQQKATFYVHLEDDILAVPQFVTTMKLAALERIEYKKPWFVLDFCQLGLIGKLFRAADLPWVVQFFLMFHNDQPADWLLKHIIYIKSCSLDFTQEECDEAQKQQWIRHKSSLFQHVGINSSLKGKIQNLTVGDYSVTRSN